MNYLKFILVSEVYVCVLVVVFFKQKTAYEIQYGLVGSEMCIRDSEEGENTFGSSENNKIVFPENAPAEIGKFVKIDSTCLLYTSDAADERSSVDLGGRRIIKKKKRRGITVTGTNHITRKNTLNEIEQA